MKAKLVSESLNEYKGRVERNTRKRLSKVPGLGLSDQETDDYINRYKSDKGVPMSSRKMSKGVERSVYDDRYEVMRDVYEFGDELVDELRDMGWEDTEMEGAGRRKGMPRVAIRIEGKSWDFYLDKNRELYADGIHLGDWSDNLIDTRKEIEKLLV